MTTEDQNKYYFLCVKEVAEILRLSTWQVYQLIKRGDIPAIHFGRSIRISSAVIDAKHRAEV